MPRIEFYQVGRIDASPQAGASYPCCTIWKDGWNDFTWITQFYLVVHMSSSEKISIGYVKILDKNTNITKLPVKFSDVGGNCCSVGQSFEYYRNLRRLTRAVQNQIYSSLSDAVVHKERYRDFSNLDGFKTSLLRYSEAMVLWEKGIEDSLHPASQAFEFDYSVYVHQIQDRIEAKFRFLDVESLPNRINVLVGKNRTGKTTILRGLANTISGGDGTASDGWFEPSRPPFSKVLVSSFSVFDPFPRPTENAAGGSYVYSGIYESAGSVRSRDRLVNDLAATVERLSKQKNNLADDIRRLELLVSLFDSALGEDFGAQIRERIGVNDRVDVRSLQELFRENTSSGQLVAAVMLTEMVEGIEPFSVVLLDEPEMHLHPNAIAGLMRSIYKLLVAYSSFAVIATHSPLLLQQIPSHYVQLFRSVDGSPVVSGVNIETFGNNLTTITDEVFQAFSTPSLFVEWARRHVQNGSELPDGLGYAAILQLRSMADENEEA